MRIEESRAGELPISRDECDTRKSGSRAAEFGAQGRAASKVAGQGLNGAKGWGTDMVFHSFNVVMDHPVVDSEQFEEIAQ